ncbi:MAG: hypothetical protein HY314_11640 [Acidobacteria bacterium]|nr:hypothetical protein [Acidobacteriota bacterium]
MDEVGVVSHPMQLSRAQSDRVFQCHRMKRTVVSTVIFTTTPFYPLLLQQWIKWSGEQERNYNYEDS